MAIFNQGNGDIKVVQADAPTERADGTPLSLSEISHYNWYMQYEDQPVALVGSTQLVDGSFTDTVNIDDQTPGKYTLYYTTVDTQTPAQESVPSNNLVLEIYPALLAAPNPPYVVS